MILKQADKKTRVLAFVLALLMVFQIFAQEGAAMRVWATDGQIVEIGGGSGDNIEGDGLPVPPAPEGDGTADDTLGKPITTPLPVTGNVTDPGSGTVTPPENDGPEFDFGIHYIGENRERNTLKYTDDFQIIYEFDFTALRYMPEGEVRVSLNTLDHEFYDGTYLTLPRVYAVIESDEVDDEGEPIGERELIELELSEYEYDEEAEEPVLNRKTIEESPFWYEFTKSTDLGGKGLVFTNYRAMTLGEKVTFRMVYDKVSYHLEDVDIDWQLNGLANVQNVTNGSGILNTMTDSKPGTDLWPLYGFVKPNVSDEEYEQWLADQMAQFSAVTFALPGDPPVPATLQALIDAEALKETPEAIVLEQDYTENVVFPAGKTMTLDLNGHTIRPDTSDGEAANTVMVLGTVAIVDHSEGKDGKIDGSEAANARGIMLSSGGAVTLENVKVCNFTMDGNGAGIHAFGSATVCLNHAEISNNNASGFGGGIFISYGKNLTAVNNSVVADNRASNGAGIAMMDRITPVAGDNGIQGLTIRGNIADANGGGIYCDGNFFGTISGLKLQNNQAAAGGGAYIKGTGELNLTKCEISNNEAKSGSGGGMYIGGANVVLTMKDTTVSGNTAAVSGGGICVAAAGSVVGLSKATISGNTANNGHGGGIYLNTTKLTIDDESEISNNTTTKSDGKAFGGGIYTGGGTTNLYSGTVSDNRANYGGGVYVTTGTTNVQKKDETDEKVFVLGNYASSYGGGIYGGSEFNIYQGHFEGNENKSRGAAAYIEHGTLNVYGGTFTKNDSSVSTVEAGYDDLHFYGGQIVGNFCNGISGYSTTAYIHGGEISGNTGAGMRGNGTLDVVMTGGTVTNNQGGGVNGRTITINDDEGSVLISGNTDNSGRGVSASGSVTISGSDVEISNNGGDGVYGAKVTISGAPAISNNDGRGVNATGTVTVSGAPTISGNQGGGIAAVDVTVSGFTKIKDNVSATYGGGIAVSKSLTLSGNVEITGNNAGTYGGGIAYAPNNKASYGGTITIENGQAIKITGNTAGTNGGGIAMGPAPAGQTNALSVSKCTIRDNTAGALGNDLYTASDSSAMSFSVPAAKDMTDGTELNIWRDDADHHTPVETALTESKAVNAYTYEKTEPVARIGDVEYTTLQAAFTAAANGDTVVLLKEVWENVTIPAELTAVTLDLNGNAFGAYDTTALTAGDGVSLTITDSSADKLGKISGSTEAAVVMGSNATLSMSGGSVSGNPGKGVILGDNATVVINSGAISGNTGGRGLTVGANSTVTMTGGEINNNVGGGVKLGEGTEMTMSGGSINGNTLNSTTAETVGVGVRLSANGKFVLYKGTVSNNKLSVDGNGSAVYVPATAKIEIHGGAISGNKTTSNSSGAVYLGGEAVMDGGEVSGNTGARHGGGFYLTGNAHFVFSGGAIRGNTADMGAGIGLYQGGNPSVEMSGTALIENNTATYHQFGGGGIWLHGGGAKATMKGGTIQNNNAQDGGGVLVSSSAQFIMEGGLITGNHSGRDIGNSIGFGHGGGISSSWNGGTVTIKGGTISNNTAQSMGGGITVNQGSVSISNEVVITGNTAGTYGGAIGVASGTVTLNTTGTITGNTAGTDGGAIGVADGTVNLNSGVITGNTAGRYGGGVSSGKGTLKMSEAKVYGNTSADIGNDVYVTNSVNVTALKNPAEYGIDAYDCWRNDSDYAEYKQTDFNELKTALGLPKTVGLTATKSTPMGDPDIVAYYIPENAEGQEDYITFTSLKAAMDAVKEGTDVPDGATIYMKKDHAENVEVPNVTFTLDLNGHTLTNFGRGAIFTLTSGADMTLTDTQGKDFCKTGETGTLTNRSDEEIPGRGIYVNSGAALTVNAGKLTGFTQANGAAIYAAGGTVTLNGGEYCNNTATSNGGAVYAGGSNTEFSMNGGAAYGNTASNGGFLYADACKVNIGKDAMIHHNTASGNGGAVYSNSATVFNMTGDSAQPQGEWSPTPEQYGCPAEAGADGGDNTVVPGFCLNSAQNGGAIYFNYGTPVITNAAFVGNTASGYGGAVYFYDKTGAAQINGGEFRNNTADNGGAIAQSNSASMTITGTKLHNNQATSAGGAIYNGAHLTLTSSDAYGATELCCNTAASGGAIYGTVSNNTGWSLNFTGAASAHHNTATGYGGAVCTANWGYTLNLSGSASLHHNEANKGGASARCSVVMKDDASLLHNHAISSGGAHWAELSSFTMSDRAEVAYNRSEGNAGAVQVSSQFTMNNGSIHDNYAVGPGGIGGTGGVNGTMGVTVKDGLIYNNSGSQGGCWAKYAGNDQISGGTFYNNEARSGAGGVWYGINSSLTVTGGEFYNNSAAGNGGVFGNWTWRADTDKFDISAGNFHDNHAGGNGGALYNSASPVAVYGTAVMTGNTADGSGGAVYTGSDLIVYGGTFTGNTAANQGGGIYAAQGLNFGYDAEGTKGAALIYGNSAHYGQDLFIPSAKEKNIIKASAMPIPSNLLVNGWLDERVGGNGLILSEIHGKSEYVYPLTLEYSLKDKIVAYVGDQSFSTVQSAITYLQQHPEAGKSIVMVADSIENVTVPAKTEVQLNLNGHTLQGFSTALSVAGNITIIDQKDETHSGTDTLGYAYGPGKAGAGTITGNSGENGGGIRISAGGKVTLNSGAIADCGADQSGAAVYVDSGSFVMNGGAIKNCTSPKGAAIYLNSSTSSATLNGGTITGVRSGTVGITAAGDGGILYNNGGMLTINGGTITENAGPCMVDTRGAGYTNITGAVFNANTGLTRGVLYLDNAAGKLTVNGSTTNAVQIIGHTVSGNGGAVYVKAGTAQVGKVLITQNRATNGGAIYQEAGTVIVSGAQILSNTATTSGGGIYQKAGTLVISDAAIQNNTAVGSRGGGIYQEGGKAEMLSGTVTGNKAPRGGGIAQKADSAGTSFNVVEGTRVYGNTSINTSAGNDIYSLYEGTKNPATEIKAVFTVGAVADMKNPKYNVWRDDNYKGTVLDVVDNIEAGLYVRKGVNASKNLMLTAYYMNDPEPLKPMAVDRVVTELNVTNFTSGTGYTSPASAITTAEKTAQELGLTVSDQTYPSRNGKTQIPYLVGTDGKLYEQEQVAQWTPGEDSSAQNHLVLTNDKLNYTLTAVIKDPAYDEDDENAQIDPNNKSKVRVWVEVALDAELDQAEISVAGSSGTSFGTHYTTLETRDGKTMQVYRTYTEVEVTQSDSIEVAPIIQLTNMKNGDTVKPQFKMWVDGNVENTQNPAQANMDRITVSAVGRYNLMLDNNSALAYSSYFNPNTGKESSKVDTSAIYGTMLGYGITAMMYNVPAKGVYGFENPGDSFTFQVHLKGDLYLDGEPVIVNGSQITTVPYFWAIKANTNGNTGYGLGQSAPTFNMKWDDEDELESVTNYAYDAAPFNSGGDYRSCYSGGGWNIVGVNRDTTNGETVLTIEVSGYSFNYSNASPTCNADGGENEQLKGDDTKGFSAGYIQLLFPFPEEQVKGLNGYLTIDMQGVVSDLNIKTASNQKPKEGDDVAYLREYFGDAAGSHAKNEMLFQDNYIAVSQGLYLSNATGNGDVMSVNHYYANSSGQMISGADGLGSSPLGVPVRVGAQVNYTSEKISTEKEYLDEDSANPHIPNPYYIPDAKRNPEIDRLEEFNYLTALNVLQKFDADIFTPVGTPKIVNRRVTGTQNTSVENAFFIKSSETLTNWDGDATDTHFKELTRSMNLTVLYAAKPDGTNWVKNERTAQQLLDAGDPKAIAKPGGEVEYEGVLYKRDQVVISDGGSADMDRYHEENLLYFETLDELHQYFGGGGECVAILYECRDCCIRNGRSISFEAAMNVSNDLGDTGKTYCTTSDSRMWTTYRPDYKKVRKVEADRKALLYEFDWDNVSYIEGGNVKGLGLAAGSGTFVGDLEDTIHYKDKEITVTRYTIEEIEGVKKWIERPETKPLTDNFGSRFSSGYKKTEYAYGSKKGDSHNGWLKGNSLLLYTLEANIFIRGLNKVSPNSNNLDKKEFNLSNGERNASFRLDPSVNESSMVTNNLVTNGSQSTEVRIRVDFPAGLKYQTGSLRINDTPDKKPDSSDYPTYRKDELDWKIGELVENADGTSYLIVSTYVTDLSRRLPDLEFDTFIKESVADQTSLTIKASIYTDYEEHNQLASVTKSSEYTILALKPQGVGIYEQVDKSVVEIAEDMTFEMVYYYSDDQTAGNAKKDVEMVSILPYCNDGRETAFHGGYKIEKIELEFVGTSAQSVLDQFTAGGGLYISPEAFHVSAMAPIPAGTETRAPSDEEVKEACREVTLKAREEAAKTSDSALAKLTATQEDTDKTTLTFDVSSLDLTVLDSDTLGRLLYAKFPEIPGKTTVKLKTTVTPMNGTALIENNGVHQKGGDIYGSDFIAPVSSDITSENASFLMSSEVRVRVVQRGITGYAFMDMNNDGKFTLGNTADTKLKNITVSLYKVNGENLVAAQDVTGETVAPYVTDLDGKYSFMDLPEGDYQVVFTAPSGYFWPISKDVDHPNKPDFGDLSMTILPGKDNDETTVDYYEKSPDVNRSVANYGTDGKLAQAKIYKPITLLKEDTLKTAEYIESNNNAGFYCVEAIFEKDWTNMVKATFTPVTFKIEGKVGETTEVTTNVAFTTPAASGDSAAAAAPGLTFEAKRDGTSLATETVAAPTAAAPNYIWKTQKVYLRAETANGKIQYARPVMEDGKIVGYTFEIEEEQLPGFDAPVKSVTLDENTGTTLFKVVNNQRSHDFAFTKIDIKSELPITGAQFSFKKDGTALKFRKVSDGVYRVAIDNVDTDPKTLVTELDVGTTGAQKGKLSVTGLPETAELALVEAKAPANYILPDGYWKLNVTPDGIASTGITSEGNPPAVKIETIVTPVVDVKGDTSYVTTYTYAIPNEPHINVGFTGGEGIGALLLLGMGLTAAGAVLLLEYRKRKQAMQNRPV